MPSRMLKVRSSIPFYLESRLINKWDFYVDKREHLLGYIICRKNYISDSDEGVRRTIRASVNDDDVVVTPDFKSRKFDGLSNFQRSALERRCDNIVKFFPDPYSVPESVRMRLKIMMQRLTAHEAQFVLDYMDEHFPVVDNGE